MRTDKRTIEELENLIMEYEAEVEQKREKVNLRLTPQRLI